MSERYANRYAGLCAGIRSYRTEAASPWLIHPIHEVAAIGRRHGARLDQRHQLAMGFLPRGSPGHRGFPHSGAHAKIDGKPLLVNGKESQRQHSVGSKPSAPCPRQSCASPLMGWFRKSSALWPGNDEFQCSSADRDWRQLSKL